MQRQGRFQRVEPKVDLDRVRQLMFPKQWNIMTYDNYDAMRHKLMVGGDEPPSEPSTETGSSSQAPPQAAFVSKTLAVKDVDCCVLANAFNHHTELYEITKPRDEEVQRCVLRRGQAFTLKLLLDRAYDMKSDDIAINFELGPEPLVSKGTQVTLPINMGCAKRKWGCKVLSHAEETLELEILTPPDIIVGKWRIIVDAMLIEERGNPKRQVRRYCHPYEIYMLFNPWIKDDQVYMEDDDLRDEYICNDSGKYFNGNKMQIYGRPWNYGQFEDFILDCAFYLLDLNKKFNYKVRGSAVHMTRAIFAMVNSQDEDGVLVGNWSGNYPDGTAPQKWVGSVAILREYWETKTPVKYGQCWVFAGITTTICRALGIPARSVTNFSSAHDCDGLLTIDTHWDAQGERLHYLNTDSVWSFHVWNEVWMSRSDLAPEFSGWQAIDATPQETSEGLYQAGPASVEGIKRGLVGFPYDTTFIFAEVNADKCHWLQQEDGKWKTQVDKHRIGCRISTQLPRKWEPRENPLSTRDKWLDFQDVDDRLDITENYKHREGTEEERAAVYRANTWSTKPNVYPKTTEDVEFDLIPKDNVVVGQPFDIVISCQNKSRQTRSVYININLESVYVTGVRKSIVKQFQCNKSIAPIKNENVVVRVSPEEYLDPRNMTETAFFKIVTLALVSETNQVYVGDDEYRLRRPDPVIEVPEKVVVNEPFKTTLKFANSMPCAMVNCSWVIEGCGIIQETTIEQKPLEPFEHCGIEMDLKASRVGKLKLVCAFNSDTLRDLCAVADVNVTAE